MVKRMRVVFLGLVLGMVALLVGVRSGEVLGLEDGPGLDAVVAPAATVGSSFTYQGYLELNGNPVDNVCDFRFDLWDAASGGSQIGGLEQILNVDVVHGRFVVRLNTVNVFGYDAFTGSKRYLRVRVRCPAGTGTFTTLSPRQEMTMVPYAASLRPGAVISGSVSTGAVNLYSNWIGAYVGRVDADGFYVQVSNFDSFQSQSAGDNGVEIRGSADYQGWFDGNIYVSGACTGCALASFGLNAGSTALKPGDAVTVLGVGTDAALADAVSPLIEVDRAQVGEAVIGVVVGWAELDVDDGVDPGSEGAAHLVPREGPAKPGAYVTIVTHGPVQVKVSAVQPSIQAGARLAVGEAGGVRSLRTVTVDGVQITEDGPSLGLALESFDDTSSKDRIWVLVNPQ